MTSSVRHRFLLLDALRGVAAVAIVLYHAGTANEIHWLGARAYLAVDFFFVLSGFVIAYAYEERLVDGAMSALEFLRVRVIRLWPLTALAALVGLAATIAAPDVMANGLVSSEALALATGCALLMLPNLGSSAGAAYPLNPPIWSVAYELVANFAYGVFAPRLTSARLRLVAIVAGLGLLVVTVRANTANNLDPARVVYSFAVGVLLYRSHRAGRRAPRLPPLAIAALLAAALFVPDVAGVSHGVTDATIALVGFPAVVWLGASVELEAAARVAEFAGEVSYPLYAIHYPLIVGAAAVAGANGWPALAVLVLATAAIVALAFLVSRVYDRPVRAALAGIRLGRRVGATS